MGPFLVCEGALDGLDNRVLDAVLVGALNIFVEIHPAGGGTSLEWLRNWLARDGSLALSVEDRNFRPDAEAARGWADTAVQRLVWRRHEIENYLLAPPVVSAAFGRIRATVSQPWTSLLPADPKAAANLLRDLAQRLIPDQAGHAACDELHRLVRSSAGLSIRRPTPPVAPGSDCPAASEWRDAIQQEAARLRSECDKARTLGELQDSAVRARYDMVLDRFHHPEFLAQDRYLQELGGKEILAAMAKHVGSLCGGQLRRQDLENELVRALADTYQPDTLFQPDCFHELADRLRPAPAPTRP